SPRPEARRSRAAPRAISPANAHRRKAAAPRRPGTKDPRRPRAAPRAAPPVVLPARKAPMVIPHLDRRPRSPSGVMLPSIDWPQGDHVDLRAATTARPTPMATTVRSVAPMPVLRAVVRGSSPVEAGVPGMDPGRCQLGICAADPVGRTVPFSPDVGLQDGVLQEGEDLLPVRGSSLAVDLAGRALDVDEVRG